MSEYTIKIFDLNNGDIIIGKLNNTDVGKDLLYVMDPVLMVQEVEFDENDNVVDIKHLYKPYVTYSKRNTFIFNPGNIISFSVPHDEVITSYINYTDWLRTGKSVPTMQDEFDDEFEEATKPAIKKYLH